MRYHAWVGKRGVTLLEVIFAAFIFAGLVTALSAMWVIHAQSQKQTGMVLVAADLAELAMNRALAQGYHGVTPGSSDITQEWEIDGQPVSNRFTTNTEVFDLTNGTGPANQGMKLIRVTVGYQDQNQHRRTYSVDSLMADETKAFP